MSIHGYKPLCQGGPGHDRCLRLSRRAGWPCGTAGFGYQPKFAAPRQLVCSSPESRLSPSAYAFRMCPQFTNITLNVAQLINPFGLSNVANPLSAHMDYDYDQRVIALMAQGLGHADQAGIITERCTWLETRWE